LDWMTSGAAAIAMETKTDTTTKARHAAGDTCFRLLPPLPPPELEEEGEEEEEQQRLEDDRWR
jgi:hypothetical protein